MANPKLEVLTTSGRIVYAAGSFASLDGPLPVDDLRSFWGTLGCSCFAF